MKKGLLILILIIGSIFLGGCWNYKELNDLALVTGVAIDKEDDNYSINLLISNAKKSQSAASEGQAQTIVYEGTGPTLSEAMTDIDLKTPKEVYLGHISVVVISEEIAAEGVNHIMDLLMRDPESRKKFYFILAKDEKASDILKIVSPLESFPSQNITVNIKNSSEIQATSTDVILSKFVAKFLEEGANPILSTITINGEPKKGQNEDSLKETSPKTVLKLDTLGIFKKDKLVGFADNRQSQGINILNNKIKTMIVKAKCEEESLVADITDIKTSSKIVFENGKPKVKIKVEATGAIKEVNCKKDLEDPKVIDEIESLIEKQLKSLTTDALEIAQDKYRSDIFGYGSLLYKENSNYWKKVKEGWDDNFFPELKIENQVTVHLKSKGSLEQTIKENAS